MFQCKSNLIVFFVILKGENSIQPKDQSKFIKKYFTSPPDKSFFAKADQIIIESTGSSGSGGVASVQTKGKKKIIDTQNMDSLRKLQEELYVLRATEIRTIMMTLNEKLRELPRDIDHPIKDELLNISAMLETEFRSLKRKRNHSNGSGDGDGGDVAAGSSSAFVNLIESPPTQKPKIATPPPKVEKFNCLRCNRTFASKAEVKINECQHQICKGCFTETVSKSRALLGCPINKCTTHIDVSRRIDQFIY